MASPSTDAGLSLFVGAGASVFAIDAARVVRIVAVDEIEAVVRQPGGGGRRVQLAQRWYPARSLIELFGGKAATTALVVVQIDADLAVALDVGACFKVAPTPHLTEVPAGVWRGRGAGVVGAFVARPVLGAAATAQVGLAIDLARVLSSGELDAMRRELREVAADDWGQP